MTIIATCSKGPSVDDVSADLLTFPLHPNLSKDPFTSSVILLYVENRCHAYIIATVDR